MANRLIQAPGEVDDLEQLLLERQLDDRVLASHCLDDTSLALLASGLPEAFLEQRAAAVEKAIYDHVQNHALFGFRDGPDVTALFDEDDEID
jgi:hypothetical protein